MAMSAREFRVIFCEVCRAARSHFEVARPDDASWEEIERMAAAAKILLRLRDHKRFKVDLAELDRIVMGAGQ